MSAFARQFGGARPPIAQSMRHEYWNGHRVKHIPRHTSKNKFAQPRVPIASHHDQRSGSVSYVGQDGIADIDVLRRSLFDLNPDVVPGKMSRNLVTADLIFSASCLLVQHDQQINGGSLDEERQSIVDGPRRCTTAVPAPHQAVEPQSLLLDVWNDHEGASGL